MIDIKEIFSKISKCSNMNNLIILLASVLVLQSCSGIKSVRNGSIATLKNNGKELEARENISEKEQNSAKKSVIKNIENFENLISKNQNINKKEDNLSSKDIDELPSESLIPTINQQLAQLQKSQNETNIRVDRLESRLEKIEKILAEMQIDIDDLIDKNTGLPATGAENSTNSSKVYTFKPDNIYNKNNDEINKIANDETFYSEKSQKQSISNKKKVDKVAKSHPEKYVKIENKRTATNELSQNVVLQQGINEFKKGNYDDSIKLLKSAKSDETSKKSVSEIAFFLAESYFNLGDYQNSIDYYNDVIKNNNSSYTAASQLKLAESNLRLGKVNNAKNEYQRLIASFPDSQYVPIARKMLQQL